jgi:hypothetical protein
MLSKKFLTTPPIINGKTQLIGLQRTVSIRDWQIEDVIKNINNKNSNILRTSSIDDKFKHCPDLKPPPIYLKRNSSI